MSLAPVVSAAARIAAQPAAKRTLVFRSTAANGKLWEDGATWCHSFAEINGPDGLRADGVLEGLSAAIRDDGSITLNPTLKVNGKAQVHWHFMGKRQYFLVGNACPPGGGVGGSIGVTFEKQQPLNIRLTFAKAANSMVDYDVWIVDPARVDVTLSFGFQHIGNLGVPTRFDIPKAPLAHGSFPLLIQDSGVFQLPGDARERRYDLVLTPVEFSTTKAGIAAAWKTVVQFK